MRAWRVPQPALGRAFEDSLNSPGISYRARASWVLALSALVAPALAADYALLGRMAPDFALPAVMGGNVRLSEHRGDVVVVTFWSSRCNTCRAQLAMLDGLAATYQSAGLAVLGVAVEDNAAGSREFARSVAVRFPLLIDSAKRVARAWRVDSLPMTVLIDRAGKVRAVHRDVMAQAGPVYQRELRPLLDE